MLCWALQMLAFLQHPYMLLAAKASLFWTSLLSSSERAAGRAEPLTPETTPIPLDCVAALMDLAGMITPPHHSSPAYKTPTISDNIMAQILMNKCLRMRLLIQPSHQNLLFHGEST